MCVCVRRYVNVTFRSSSLRSLSFISGNRQKFQGKKQLDSFLNHLSIRIVYTQGLCPLPPTKIQSGRREFSDCSVSRVSLTFLTRSKCVPAASFNPGCLRFVRSFEWTRPKENYFTFCLFPFPSVGCYARDSNALWKLHEETREMRGRSEYVGEAIYTYVHTYIVRTWRGNMSFYLQNVFHHLLPLLVHRREETIRMAFFVVA